MDCDLAYKDADFIIISTPTNYDPEMNYLHYFIGRSCLKNTRNKFKSCYCY